MNHGVVKLREHPDIVAFYNAARAYCDVVESDLPAEESRLLRVLTALSRLYSCAHSLPMVEVDDVPDVPEEFTVTDAQYQAVFHRHSVILGGDTDYWCFWDSTEVKPDATAPEPSMGWLPDDLADIYRDVAPGVRAWESGREELLPSVVFDWSYPSFHTHWGRHAVNAMTALHEIVHNRRIPFDTRG